MTNYKILDFYESQGFSLLPIAKNQKIPIESAWTSKTHKNKTEWIQWLNDGLNIGVRCGQVSNITVIDVDVKPIPEEIKKILDKYPTFSQVTSKGTHFIYHYCKDLPKMRLDDLKIDIENDGGQIVLFPSVVDGVKRKINHDEIAEFPQELLDFLKSKIPSQNITSKDKLIEEYITNNEEFNLELIGEGKRHMSLLKLGGIFKKQMNVSQTDFVLNVINKTCCTPPLPMREVDNIITSLEKYHQFDEIELASRILQYFKIVEEAGNRDIREALGETKAEGKQRIDKAIKYLEKEGFLFKKRRIYHLIKRAEWKDSLLDEGKIIDFKIPYFNNSVILRQGDLVIIGGKPKIGKTGIALNIIKRFVEQGIKPFYISLESGARFLSLAKTLGLKEGDFNWAIHFSPEDVELEKDAVSIVDWILPSEYAETDKLFKHFAEQLVKNGGMLICFVQLKNDGRFFAENMIPMFPALVARYLYDNDDSGSSGKFLLDYIREPKINSKKVIIPCIYDFNSKILKEVE